jgi:signal peptidase I
MDVTDGIGYKKQQDTLLFRALTAKGAVRLRSVPESAVIQEISKGPEQGIFPQINEWNRDNLGPIYIPQQGKTVARNHYHFTKES